MDVHSSATKGDWTLHSRLKELVAERERKEQRRIHQKQIAEEAKVSEMAVSRWMRPEPFMKIEVEVATKLCKWLGCEIGDLLYFERSLN